MGQSVPSLRRVFVEDLRRMRFSRDYWRELRELYAFYLDEEERTRLADMGRVRRSVMVLGWLLHSLFMKLSPARRIMLLLSVVLTILGNTSFRLMGWGFSADLRPWGWVLLLLTLMLELKDKLLARDEIQIARDVQIALQPRSNPTVPGWSFWCYSRPANDVGGDLVDYIALDGFRHGVALGDVAGKGLGAALLSAKLQATLRALVPEAVSLDELGTRVNTILHRDGIDNRYATLFYAEVEHDSGRMRYLNAGHNPAFLIRRGGVERLSASSFPLGMLPRVAYEERSLDLVQGEVLLVYSDGLTEASNPAGEEFGAARLESLVSGLGSLEPQAVGERLLTEVDRFLGDARAADDLSLVVIRRC
jgi:phosphoserine phosphatase RsbU/P